MPSCTLLLSDPLPLSRVPLCPSRASLVAPPHQAYKSYHGESAEMKAARNAALKLADNFLLAAPDPTEEEVMMSLATTIDVLTRLK